MCVWNSRGGEGDVPLAFVPGRPGTSVAFTCIKS